MAVYSGNRPNWTRRVRSAVDCFALERSLRLMNNPLYKGMREQNGEFPIEKAVLNE
jgi:hypothetical protein